MTTPPAAPWIRVYNDAKITVPAMTDAVFQQVLFQICKDFFDKTNIWVETVPVPVQPNVTVYPFTLANLGLPNRLLLLYDPTLIDPNPKWVQSNIQMAVPGTITLSYSPSSAVTWNAIVAKICGDPTDANNYPSMVPADYWIIDKYRECLVSGVVGRLLMMPAKAFSNPQLAAWYRQTYIAERGKARQDANQANVISGQRWMFPQGWSAINRRGWT